MYMYLYMDWYTLHVKASDNDNICTCCVLDILHGHSQCESML